MSAAYGTPVSPTGTAAPRELAGVWIRVVQYIVDAILVGIVSSIISLPFGVGLTTSFGEDGGPAVSATSWILGVVASALGFVVVPLLAKGQTVGMMLFRIRIVDAAGAPAQVGPLLIRWVLLVVDLILLGLVGLIVMLVREDNRRVGDLVAGTYVVKA
jgi:uncharacterized RDD family membrane protein YckC